MSLDATVAECAKVLRPKNEKPSDTKMAWLPFGNYLLIYHSQQIMVWQIHPIATADYNDQVWNDNGVTFITNLQGYDAEYPLIYLDCHIQPCNEDACKFEIFVVAVSSNKSMAFVWKILFFGIYCS